MQLFLFSVETAKVDAVGSPKYERTNKNIGNQSAEHIARQPHPLMLPDKVVAEDDLYQHEQHKYS